jgi:cysteinyl-tRNA synthetase
MRRIAARAEAKARRDFAEADRIRDELKSEGVLLEDGAEGTTWRRA